MDSRSTADGGLSRRTQIIKRIVADFNSSEYLLERFGPEYTGRDEMDDDFKYPPHLRAERFEIDGIKCELLSVDKESEISDSLRESAGRWTILHFHGGGYVGAMRRSYKNMAGLYSEVGRGATVLTVDYRVAPENPFPAALDDAVAAYDWLLDSGCSPENIVFAGDSAGGGLSMALCHVLKSSWRERTAGLILMSPWADLTASGSSYTDNKDIDPVFGGSRAELIYNNPYIGDADPRDPRISPMFGDFTGFPPMLIQVGTDEMLLSDSEAVASKARSAGVKVRFTKYPGMFHVFQMAGTLMDESKSAWAEVGRFLSEI